MSSLPTRCFAIAWPAPRVCTLVLFIILSLKEFTHNLDLQLSFKKHNCQVVVIRNCSSIYYNYRDCARLLAVCLCILMAWRLLISQQPQEKTPWCTIIHNCTITTYALCILLGVEWYQDHRDPSFHCRVMAASVSATQECWFWKKHVAIPMVKCSIYLL